MTTEISQNEHQEIAQIVLNTCGIVLDESKGYLIESRFTGLAEQYGCKTIVELARKVKSGNDTELKNKFIDAITTRETHFFRDTTPFETLEKKVLPELIAAKAGTPYAQRLRIWSAACSSGQEIYSIAISINKLINNIDNWDISIIGTDISETAVAKASRGEYSQFEIGRGLKEEEIEQHFTKEERQWKIKDKTRSLVTFKQRNLLDSFEDLGRFDIIFCRNVAIYFDLFTKRDLFERISKVLTPEGYLFVGSSETLASFGTKFQPQNFERSVFYQPNKQATSAVL